MRNRLDRWTRVRPSMFICIIESFAATATMSMQRCEHEHKQHHQIMSLATNKTKLPHFRWLVYYMRGNCWTKNVPTDYTSRRHPSSIATPPKSATSPPDGIGNFSPDPNNPNNQAQRILIEREADFHCWKILMDTINHPDGQRRALFRKVSAAHFGRGPSYHISILCALARFSRFPFASCGVVAENVGEMWSKRRFRIFLLISIHFLLLLQWPQCWMPSGCPLDCLCACIWQLAKLIWKLFRRISAGALFIFRPTAGISRSDI